MSKYNEFIADPTTNPFTGRPIKPGGSVFNNLVKKAEEYYGLSVIMDADACTLLEAEYPILDLDENTYGVSQKQQRGQEDRYQIARIGPFRYFAIFDGHGGNIIYDPETNIISAVDYANNFLHLRLSEELDGVNLSIPKDVINAIRNAIIKLDTEMYENKVVNGTTASIVLIDDCHDLIYQINIGDTRSIIFNRNNIILATKDHKPQHKQERERSINAGAFVQKWDDIYRITRPNTPSGIAISRALGDFELKFNNDLPYDPINGAISANPDIKVSRKVPGYVLLTSDAPFDFDIYTNKSLVRLTNKLLQENNNDLQQTVEKMVQKITSNNRITDDTTLLLSAI